MMHKKQKILVGLSGGVDSAVSLYLLKKAGHEVHAGFMINFLEPENPHCTTKVDLAEAKRVADFLEVPFFTFDYREEYESRIIDYIYREYGAGRTPNPDVFCNNLVKFDLFLCEALDMGYDAIATGHYARLDAENRLLKGLDANKDQSYFLSRLSPFQRAHAHFPIGNLEKTMVRKIANEANLPNAQRKDSQGLCFIGKIPMREFLAKKFEKNPGNILDARGNILGTHDGAFSFTIGQRKGIQIGGGPALFVVAKDVKKNTITVGTKEDLDLFSLQCMISDYVGENLEEEKYYSVKIRYRQDDQKAKIQKISPKAFSVIFETPQRAIASGQICVFYEGNLVVGSGIIQ